MGTERDTDGLWTRLKGEPRLWGWAMLTCVLVVCIFMAGLYGAHRMELNRASEVLDSLRKARVDLAKGALKIEIAHDVEMNSTELAEGRVLTEQALALLVHTVRHHRVGESKDSEAWIEELGGYAGAYRGELDKIADGMPHVCAEVRALYGELERLAEQADNDQRERLQALRTRSIASYSTLLAGAFAMLAVVCVGMFVAGKEQFRSGRMLRLAAEATGVAYWEEDVASGQMVWRASRLAAFGGAAAPESFDQLLGGAVSPADRKTLSNTRQAALAGRPAHTVEVKLRLPGASESGWVMVKIVAMGQEGRPATSLLGVIMDVTARRLEEEARKQEEVARGQVELRFRELFELVPAGLVYGRRDGVLHHINHRADEIFGYARDEVSPLERWWVRAYPDPDYRRQVQEEWERDVAQAAAEGKDIPVREYQVMTKSGRTRTVEFSGRVIGEELLLVVDDVTERKQAEVKMRFHEAVLEETGRIAKVGGWSFDVRTGEGYWTREVASIHDLDPNVEPNRNIGLSFYTPDSRARAEAAIAAAIERAEPYDLHLEMLTAKGVRKWVRTIGHPVLEHGVVVRLRGSFQDITELRAMIDARERQTRRMSLLADISSRLVLSEPSGSLLEGIFTDLSSEIAVDMFVNYMLSPDGVMLSLEGSVGLTQKQQADLASLPVGESLAGLVAKSRRPVFYADLPSTNEPQAKRVLALGIRAYAGFPLMAGERIIGTVSFGSRQRDNFSEEDLRLMKAVTDQVAAGLERRRLIEALQGSEEVFLQMAENIEEVFWVWDFSTKKYIYLSPAFERIWGIPCARVMERPDILLETIVESDRERVRVAFARARDLFGETEYRITRPDGTLRHVVDRGYPVRDRQGRFYRRVGVVVDMTDHNDLREKFLRAQRLEALGTLAGGVAHDLNNILSPILMMGPLFREKMSAPEDQRVLILVEQAARRGAEVVAQLLKYSRGSLNGEMTDTRLEHLVSEVAHLAGETFPKNIAVRREVALNLPAVLANATRMHQVLMNLSVNARDAMPRGGILILGARVAHVTPEFALTHRDAVPGPYVVLVVSDTGTGISPAVRERMFESFFTTKEVGKGTGLGLSTVQEIVREHRGFIEVTSEVGRGTKFEVFLPSTVAALAVDQPVEVVEVARGRGEKILLVDDEEQVRGAIAAVLESAGFRVVSVAGGEQALAVLHQAQPEVALLLTDLMMPGMDGWELIAAAHKLWPKLPVVLCTGTDHKISQEECAAFRVSAVLPKPPTMAALLQTVRGAMRAV